MHPSTRTAGLAFAATLFLGAGLLVGQLRAPAATPAAGPSTTSAASTAPLTLPASTRKSPVVKSMPFVETAPIQVAIKLLDPDRGRRPKGYNGEGGSCETKLKWDFGFDSTKPVVTKVDGEFVATVRCQAPWAKVILAFDIWLPDRSPRWLTDHEETHRAISERCYAEAIPQLSALLKQMNGKTYEVRAATEPLALRAAHDAPTKEFNDAYWRLLPGREMRLNGEFDRITENGARQEKTNREIMDAIFADDARHEEATTTRASP